MVFDASRRKFIRNISIAGIATTGIAVFLDKCTRVIEAADLKPDDLVDCAFRLTDASSLLNLEFYFINCVFDSQKEKVTAKYGPHENYMVVRLPQQHLIEKNFDPLKEKNFDPRHSGELKAAVYITGFSYLVFRILFPRDPLISFEDGYQSRFWTLEDGQHTDIKLTRNDLLSWNNEHKFRLVVRQDLTQSLFELEPVPNYDKPQAAIGSKQNQYPFQQEDKDLTNTTEIKNGSFSINRLPKVAGDPVTALEIPWRLIISPRIPDSGRFKFVWHIPSTKVKKHDGQLWTASLSVEEKKIKDKTGTPQSEGLDSLLVQLEWMILGSPDFPKPKKTFAANEWLLRSTDRSDLVALYIKLKILARSQRITLSSLGSSIQFQLKHDKFEEALRRKPPIPLIGWNEVVSLGRDEKVEVSTLFLEAEFGHKMAHIVISKRELIMGYYPMIRKGYILPLDISKDFSTHITQTVKETSGDKKNTQNKIQSKFNSPFRKITFIDTQPKEIETGEYCHDKLTHTSVSFQFEAVDWHENVIRFNKKINCLPFGAVVDFERKMNAGNPSVNIVSPDLANDIKSDTIISLKDTLQMLPDSIDIPFLKTDSIRNVPDTYRRTLDSLDKLISNKQKIIGLKQNVEAVFSTQSEAIRDDFQMYFDDVTALFKNEIAEAYAKLTPTTRSTIKVEIGKLNNQKIAGLLIKKYFLENLLFRQKIEQFLSSSTAFSNIVAYIMQELIPSPSIIYECTNQVLNKVKGLIPTDFYHLFVLNIDLSKIEQTLTRFPDLKNKLKAWEAFQLIFIEEWIKTVFNDYPSISDQKFIQGAIEFYKEVQITNPEMARIGEKFYPIFNGTDLDPIIFGIRERLMNFYQIETLAQHIPNLVMLEKQRIGYVLKEAAGKETTPLLNKIGKAEKQQKKSLSELESEYIVFQGALHEKANQTFDFFHEFAIIPELQQAKVYVNALNKLIGENIPLSINYAKEYLENQVEDTAFEAGQNASMVFAQVLQNSRDQIKGLIQKMGDEMPGINVEIPGHFLTYLRNPREINTKMLKELGYTEQQISDVVEASKDLVFISENIKDLIKTAGDFNSVDPKLYFKDLGARLFGGIPLEDILAVGFDLPRITALPDQLLYQFSTDSFSEHRAAFVEFKPSVNVDSSKGDATPTRLDLFVSKSFKHSSEVYAYTRLNNFSVGVVIGGTNVLTVLFDSFKITASPGQPKHTDISIAGVKLGGPLEFISDLAKRFMAPGNGMRIKPGPKNLEVIYGIGLPSISAPAFNFRNLQLNIGLNIPYDPASLRPVSFTFGLNSPENKFLIAAGIYGGRGHFQLRATPKGIEHIDIGMEMGAYSTLDLGIGQGEVFLFFGLWFVCGKDVATNENTVKGVAYVLCSGSATVLGFITIGVSVLIAMTYMKTGNQSVFYGEAIVIYSIKIAFFKKEFSVHYKKTIVGSDDGSSSAAIATPQQAMIAGFIPEAAVGEKKSSQGTSQNGFRDVFDNEKKFAEYLSCFIVD